MRDSLLSLRRNGLSRTFRSTPPTRNSALTVIALTRGRPFMNIRTAPEISLGEECLDASRKEFE